MPKPMILFQKNAKSYDTASKNAKSYDTASKNAKSYDPI
jgi:hypothetical protein